MSISGKDGLAIIGKCPGGPHYWMISGSQEDLCTASATEPLGLDLSVAILISMILPIVSSHTAAFLWKEEGG